MFTDGEVQQFTEQGFIIVPRLLTQDFCSKLLNCAQKELQIAAEPVEYEADVNYPGAPISRHAPGGNTVRRLLQAYSRNPIFQQLATAPLIIARLRSLLGDSIYMSQAHHNCIMTKQPNFSSKTSWHRDIRYWNFQHPQLITVWTAIKHEYSQNGCLSVIPGSHTLDASLLQFDDSQFLREDTLENRESLNSAIAIELNPGDVLFFHCQLLHAAGNNATNETKISLVFTYHGENNRPIAQTRSAAFPELKIDS